MVPRYKNMFFEWEGGLCSKRSSLRSATISDPTFRCRFSIFSWKHYCFPTFVTLGHVQTTLEHLKIQTEEVTSFILCKSHQRFVFLERKISSDEDSEDESSPKKKSKSKRKRNSKIAMTIHWWCSILDFKTQILSIPRVVKVCDVLTVLENYV